MGMIFGKKKIFSEDSKFVIFYFDEKKVKIFVAINLDASKVYLFLFNDFVSNCKI